MCIRDSNYVGYRDDKLGIGENGEVVVADTAWPRPSRSGKLEIYCQFKADNVNRTGLNSEPIKPYANYFVPNRGYQDTFADWDAKVKGAYPLQAYTPHYMRRAHTCYDNMTWTQEAFRNPVFMNAQDAEERGIKAGDTVVCYNDFGRMLRIAQPLQGMMPGTVGIPVSYTHLDVYKRQGRVAAVEQGLHLTGHLEEVDGRGERDGVGRDDALHDGGRIVFQRACGAGLASQTPAAKLDALAA